MKNKGLIIAIAAFAVVDVVAVGVLLATRGAKNPYTFIDVKDYKDKDEQQISQQVLTDLDRVVTRPPEGTESLSDGELVMAFSAEVQEAGFIRNYASVETDRTVSLVMQDGSLLVYIPSDGDTMSGTEESFRVLALDCLDDGVAEMAAAWIAENVKDMDEADNNQTGQDVDGIKAALGDLKAQNDRVIFWQGHGAAYNDPAEEKEQSCLILGAKSWSDFTSDAQKEDLAAHRLIRTTDGSNHALALTPSFVTAYAAETEGGLFVCGSCEFLKNDSFENAFFQKGLHGVIGPVGLVTRDYSNAMLMSIAEGLTEKYKNRELYFAAADALIYAKEEQSGLNGGVDFAYRRSPAMEEFHLLPVTSIRGTLLADSGVMPNDIKVRLFQGSDGVELSPEDDFSYEIWGLDPDSSYRLEVLVDGQLVREMEISNLERFKMQQIPEIDIRKHELLITVLDSDQRPIPDATVSVSPEYGEDCYAQQNGDVYIANAYPGRLEVEISAPKYEGQRTTLENFPETSTVTVNMEVDPITASLEESLEVIREYGFGDIWYFTSYPYSNLSYQILPETVQDMGDYYLAQAYFCRPLTIPAGSKKGQKIDAVHPDGSVLHLECTSADQNRAYFKEVGSRYAEEYNTRKDVTVKGQEVIFMGSYDALMDPFYLGYLKISKSCITGIEIMRDFRTITWSDLQKVDSYSGKVTFNGMYMEDDGTVTRLVFCGD